MLDEDEYKSIEDGIRLGVHAVQVRRVQESRSMRKDDEEELYREMAARYFAITGANDVEYPEIRHHRLSSGGHPV
jgi:hypothetical protein